MLALILALSFVAEIVRFIDVHVNLFAVILLHIACVASYKACLLLGRLREICNFLTVRVHHDSCRLTTAFEAPTLAVL